MVGYSHFDAGASTGPRPREGAGRRCAPPRGRIGLRSHRQSPRNLRKLSSFGRRKTEKLRYEKITPNPYAMWTARRVAATPALRGHPVGPAPCTPQAHACRPLEYLHLAVPLAHGANPREFSPPDETNYKTTANLERTKEYEADPNRIQIPHCDRASRARRGLRYRNPEQTEPGHRRRLQNHHPDQAGPGRRASVAAGGQGDAGQLSRQDLLRPAGREEQ